MSELRDELLSDISQSKTLSRKRLLVLALVLVFGWYVGVLLFGNNSIIRLNELSNELQRLKVRIDGVKKANASLQKELFEISQIRGED